MQTCYNCGKEVADETLICPDCGALVRRYANLPPEPANTPPVAVQPPIAPQVRLMGGVRVWLIVLIVIASYMVLSSLSAIFLALNIEELKLMLAEPELAGIGALYADFIDLLPQMIPIFAILGVLYAAKLFCHIWLLASAKRRAFFFSIGVSLGALLGFALLGGSLASSFLFLDPLFTWFGLRRFWPYMQK